MKKLIFSTFAAVLFSVAAFAQTKAIQTVKISTPTVQCNMCKKTIEDLLKRYDGVMTVNVNVKRKETTVKYITDRTNEEIIKTAIANAGYDASEIAANADSYKALPKCCKKPEDGGPKTKQ
ncbi:MAG TPA: cation transporter [Flavisolibacter sp.]|nr:cation transporter [Flavisolibacter sp.]